MRTVEIEREKLDRLIRAALTAESQGIQPPDQVWHRVLRRVEDQNDRLAFQEAVRAEQPMAPVHAIS